MMDETKLELGRYVYGGSGLRAQEHEQGTGWVTYLLKDTTKGLKWEWSRPAWVACCSTWLQFSPAHSMHACCFVITCSTGLHRPNALVHSFACMIDPSTWLFCFESLPCSLALHASMRFLQTKLLLPLMLVPCMSFDDNCWRGISWCIIVYVWLS
jgi:hypothetical protein